MQFIALDVETANADLASICQIGVARFVDGTFAEKWESLVDPEDEFDPTCVAIHGIDEACVAGRPTFPALAGDVSRLVADTVVATHTAFDQRSIRSVFAKYGLACPEVTWLDTARVVRRAWPDYCRSGYGLRPTADRLGIEFKHHNAGEDARAAGEILLHAIRQTGVSLDEWVVRSRNPIGTSVRGTKSDRITREGNPEGPLFGEVAVFTGTLSMRKREAADLAAAAGCNVADSVTKQTTLLIVGYQDIRKLGGHEKSSKHRKAEQLLKSGQQIRILQESDFQAIASFTG